MVLDFSLHTLHLKPCKLQGSEGYSVSTSVSVDNVESVSYGEKAAELIKNREKWVKDVYFPLVLQLTTGCYELVFTSDIYIKVY